MDARRRILIVEDEPVLAKNLARFLARRGWKAKTARWARNAVDELRRSASEVLLLDIDLPDGDGLEILREVRAACPNLKIIMMSGRSAFEEQMHAQRLAPCEFLAKPFSLRELAGTLNEANRCRNLIGKRG